MTDATSGDRARTGSTAQPTGAKGPDELRRQIEQTRSQLGETVEELAGKADVKGRAKARAADLRDKAGAMTVQLRSSAAHAGHTVQEKAGRAGHSAEERVPDRPRGAVRSGLGRPRVLLAAGAACALGTATGVLAYRHQGHR
ncbi:DUF3618 domain-containing protein [Streptomyces parvulus]|uniref:DUF3618 domain-containing protein n=1 Tax=Streptomyces parvulus TaxID=146923 RepID=UPI0036FE5015